MIQVFKTFHLTCMLCVDKTRQTDYLTSLLQYVLVSDNVQWLYIFVLYYILLRALYVFEVICWSILIDQ